MDGMIRSLYPVGLKDEDTKVKKLYTELAKTNIHIENGYYNGLIFFTFKFFSANDKYQSLSIISICTAVVVA
jgi:hypothetical protein